MLGVGGTCNPSKTCIYSPTICPQLGLGHGSGQMLWMWDRSKLNPIPKPHRPERQAHPMASSPTGKDYTRASAGETPNRKGHSPKGTYHKPKTETPPKPLKPQSGGKIELAEWVSSIDSGPAARGSILNIKVISSCAPALYNEKQTK